MQRKAMFQRHGVLRRDGEPNLVNTASSETTAEAAATDALVCGAIKLGPNLTKLVKETNKAKKITDRVKKKLQKIKEEK